MLVKLKPEVKEKWLKALRSGEYTQTREILQDSAGFCCLGVLCDIHAKDHSGSWATTTKEIDDGVTIGQLAYLDHDANLPSSVINWAFDTDSEFVSPEVQFKKRAINEEEYSTKLTYLNDSLGYNFEKIAKVIEESL